MTDEQIKHMAERFLQWKLPENFRPDAGISFKAEFNEHTAHPMKHEPTGTNLFDYGQANAMVEWIIEGLPKSGPENGPKPPSIEGDQTRAEGAASDELPSTSTRLYRQLGEQLAQGHLQSADLTPEALAMINAVPVSEADHKGPLWAERDVAGWWNVCEGLGAVTAVASYCTEEHALLFAAAPELLAAATVAEIILRDKGYSDHPSNVLGALQAAISKATPGEET